MKGLIIATCLTLATVTIARAQTEHAQFDFPVTISGQRHILTYDGTHDVSEDADPRIKLVIFVHHSGSQNPTTYFKHLSNALNAADRDRCALNLKSTTLVVSPNPRWARSGRELFYANRDSIWSVSIGAGAQIESGVPRAVASLGRAQLSMFDVLPGDAGFVVLAPGVAEDARVTVTLNFAEGLSGSAARRP